MKQLILTTVAVFVCGTSISFGAEKEGAEAPKAAPEVADKKAEGAEAPKATPELADRKGGMEKGRESAKLRGELAEITRICGLNEEQQTKLIAINDARVKAMQALMATSAEQIAAILTPEQKVKWNEGLLMEFVRREFRKITFSDEQNAKIKAEIATLTKDTLFMMNEQNIQKVKGLMAFIKEKVLTEEQKLAAKESSKLLETRRTPESIIKKDAKTP